MNGDYSWRQGDLIVNKENFVFVLSFVESQLFWRKKKKRRKNRKFLFIVVIQAS